MRRAELALPPEECRAVLKRGDYGTIAMLGADGAPYAVPVNYYYHEQENALFFHCAEEGEKLDALRHCDRVCFTVVEQYQTVPEKLTSHFQCVIVKGKVSLITDHAQRARRLEELCLRFCSKALTKEQIRDKAQGGAGKTMVVQIEVLELTGKGKRT